MTHDHIKLTSEKMLGVECKWTMQNTDH